MERKRKQMSVLGRRDNTYSSQFRKEDTDGDPVGQQDPVLTISADDRARLKYPQWAPVWDRRQELKFENPKPFIHVDRALFGDPTFESLLSVTGVEHERLSPKLGSVVKGLQLSELTATQKDDLALLVEQRGVVAFRGQDFKSQSFEFIKKWATHFGPLHVHPTSGSPLGQSVFHTTFRRGGASEQKNMMSDRLNALIWHSDVSYERQPPGITIFTMLQTGVGGDTQFIDTIEAYERLSPLMQELIQRLKVFTTSKDLTSVSASKGDVVRKESVDSVHPLVRYHPVLRRKCLFINKSFSRKIVGLKMEESDSLLMFLLHHIESCLDAHVRVRWDEETVVIWDNRRLVHTATFDWDSNDIRHAFRVTTQAERPVATEAEYHRWTPKLEQEPFAVYKE